MRFSATKSISIRIRIEFEFISFSLSCHMKISCYTYICGHLNPKLNGFQGLWRASPYWTRHELSLRSLFLDLWISLITKSSSFNVQWTEQVTNEITTDGKLFRIDNKSLVFISFNLKIYLNQLDGCDSILIMFF